MTIDFAKTAPEVMPPVLLCWPTTSEVDVRMAVEAGSPTDIPLLVVVV